MSKRLRIQTNTALDVINSNIPLQLTTGTETPLDSLALQLANSSGNVLVQGVFFLSKPQVTVGNGAGGKVSTTIKIYRDAALTNLAYTFEETLVFAAQFDTIPVTQHLLPIQFKEEPILKVTEDTVHYYITITINYDNIVDPQLTNVELTQYNVTATEIAE